MEISGKAYEHLRGIALIWIKQAQQVGLKVKPYLTGVSVGAI